MQSAPYSSPDASSAARLASLMSDAGPSSPPPPRLALTRPAMGSPQRLRSLKEASASSSKPLHCGCAIVHWLCHCVRCGTLPSLLPSPHNAHRRALQARARTCQMTCRPHATPPRAPPPARAPAPGRPSTPGAPPHTQACRPSWRERRQTPRPRRCGRSRGRGRPSAPPAPSRGGCEGLYACMQCLL